MQLTDAIGSIRKYAGSGNLEEALEIVKHRSKSVPSEADRLYEEAIAIALSSRHQLGEEKTIRVWARIANFLVENSRSYYDVLHALALITTAIESTTDKAVQAALLCLKSKFQENIELHPQAVASAKASVDLWDAESSARAFSISEVEESMRARRWLETLTAPAPLD